MASSLPLFFIVTKFQDHHPPPIELYTFTFLIFRVSLFLLLSVRLALSSLLHVSSLHEIRRSFFFFYIELMYVHHPISNKTHLENIWKIIFGISSAIQIRNKF